jgi:hypothetical protein
VGLGLLAWGFVGLRLSDRAEEQYFKPTEEDRAALREITPRITAVDRDSGGGGVRDSSSSSSSSRAITSTTDDNHNNTTPGRND